MPEYTLLAVASVPAVVAVEAWWLRTGLLRTTRYWLAMAIVIAFMVAVDGWLTKLSDPIVLYAETATSGVRVPWDIPVEDFAFGWSMCTLTLVLWRWRTAREDARSAGDYTP